MSTTRRAAGIARAPRAANRGSTRAARPWATPATTPGAATSDRSSRVAASRRRGARGSSRTAQRPDRLRLAQRAGLLVERLADGLDGRAGGRHEDVVLRVEVAVEGTLGDAGGVTDLADTHALVAAAGERHPGHGEQTVPGLAGSRVIEARRQERIPGLRGQLLGTHGEEIGEQLADGLERQVLAIPEQADDGERGHVALVVEEPVRGGLGRRRQQAQPAVVVDRGHRDPGALGQDRHGKPYGRRGSGPRDRGGDLFHASLFTTQTFVWGKIGDNLGGAPDVALPVRGLSTDAPRHPTQEWSPFRARSRRKYGAIRVSATSGWRAAVSSSACGSAIASTVRPAPSTAFSHPVSVRRA